MNNRLFCFFFLPVFLFLCAHAHARDTKPNVILIMADDVGIEGFGLYGSEYQTPHIDALGAAGQTFSNAHATPLCTPTRTRLMTARENAKNYEAFAYLNPEERTFAHAFKEAGYATGVVGKWQLAGSGFDGRRGARPWEAGFDEWHLWQLRRGDAAGSRYWRPSHSVNGRFRIAQKGFGPDIQNDFAKDFIERHKDKPFLLYYPMVLPHSPFVRTPTSREARTRREKFAGMIAHMDLLIGEIVGHLKDMGIADNTILVFTSDNGTDQRIRSYWNNNPICGGKGRPTLSGTHVPLIVSWPGKIAKGVKRGDLFDLMDLYPTLADLASVSYDPSAIDGISHAPTLLGRSERQRDWIYMHYAPAWLRLPAKFVFDTDWKLYGDGRFMALDPDTNTETEVDIESLTGADAARYRQFEEIIDRDTRPLDYTRYPMCAGRRSLRDRVPATVAGCRVNGQEVSPGTVRDWKRCR